MISNPVIKDKIKEETGDNKAMYDFLLDIVDKENEYYNYKKEYPRIIEQLLGKGEI